MYSAMPADKDVIAYRVSDARLALSELRRLASKSFGEMSVDERYSMRYNIIALVEAIVSLCIHIAVEEYGLRPRTYREALRLVSEKIGVECMGDLEALVGLRNILVHRYWIVDDERIYRSIKENFKCIEKLLNRILEEYGGEGDEHSLLLC